MFDNEPASSSSPSDLAENIDDPTKPLVTSPYHDNNSSTTSSTSSPLPHISTPTDTHFPLSSPTADDPPTHPPTPTSIRTEWVNAIFGPSYFSPTPPPSYSPPTRGTGTANLSSFVSFTTSIPPSTGDRKLGLTISRIPLGVYAHTISPGSEASAAGVSVGSVLISVNGLGIVGEPTHKALERLWQYEGWWGDGVDGPVEMVFVRGGVRYAVIFLTKAPWGISWAPCGNFALVQRSYSFAQQAGIRRGCLIAGVNDESLRTLDHMSAASLLKELFCRKEEITITLAYTPADSRTSSAGPKKETNVEAEAKEGGVATFWRDTMVCGGGGRQVKSPVRHVSELATRVAAGEVIPELEWGRKLKLEERDRPKSVYDELPKMENITLKWDGMDCLLYCLKFNRAAFSEEAFTALKNERGVLGRCGVNDGLFLLQFLGVLGDVDKKVGKELNNVLVELALNSDNICLRLYYLIKSFLNNCSESQARALDTLRNNLTDCLAEKCEEMTAHQNVDLLLNSSTITEKDSKEEITIIEATTETSSLPESQTEITPPPTPLRTKDKIDNSPNIENTAKATKKKKKTRKISFRMFRSSKQFEKLTPVEDNDSNTPEQTLSEEPIPEESSLNEEDEPSENVIRSTTPPLPLSKPTPILRKFPDTLAVDTCATQSSFMAHSEPTPISTQLENLDWFLENIYEISQEASKNLMKPMSQRLSDAIQPWTPSREKSLREATGVFRQRLKELNIKSIQRKSNPILNPVDALELLDDLDPDYSFILPSAHIPLLLAWNLHYGKGISEVVHTTKIEVIALRGAKNPDEYYTVNGTVSGVSKETSRSTLGPYFETTLHRWYDDNTISFETRNSRGQPKTLSLKLSSVTNDESRDVGYAWVTLPPPHTKRTIHVPLYPTTEPIDYDQHGTSTPPLSSLTLEIQMSISTYKTTKKRLLLYKHGDDLRQETLSLQFLDVCASLLKSSGLDLKMRTFACTPLSPDSGFVEWVEGSVPLSEICHGEVEAWCRYASVKSFRQGGLGRENPIQDYLRAWSFDEEAPYWIEREVMDNYVKSCAGYCVATYLLGVGDRHLDNLLLTPRGQFLHCDFSFILGRDPKTYIPMRITEEMVLGMGGRDSDNFAKFLSLAGASFVALRRHNNLRVLLSLMRLMINSNIPDLSVHQSAEDVLMSMRYRFRLDLSEDDALSFMERLIEQSIGNKLWIAVDAIHSLGKHF